MTTTNHKINILFCVIVIMIIVALLCFILGRIPYNGAKSLNIVVKDLSFTLKKRDPNPFNLEGHSFSKIFLSNFNEIKIPNIRRIQLISDGKEPETLNVEKGSLTIKGKSYSNCTFFNVRINQFDIEKDEKIGIKVGEGDSSVTFLISKGKGSFDMIGNNELKVDVTNGDLVINNESSTKGFNGTIKIQLMEGIKSRISVFAKSNKNQYAIRIPISEKKELSDENLITQELTSLHTKSLMLIQNGEIFGSLDKEPEIIRSGDSIEMEAEAADSIEMRNIRISTDGIKVNFSGKFKKLRNISKNKNYLPSLLDLLYHQQFIIIWAIVTNFILTLFKFFWEPNKNKNQNSTEE